MNPFSSLPVQEPSTVTVVALLAEPVHPLRPQAASSTTMMSTGRTTHFTPLMCLPTVFVQTGLDGDENQARDHHGSNGNPNWQTVGVLGGNQISVEPVA